MFGINGLVFRLIGSRVQGHRVSGFQGSKLSGSGFRALSGGRG